MRPFSCTALLGLTLLAAPSPAQEPFAVYVSLSSDSALAGQAVEDEEILLHDAFGATRVAWPGETLAALAGDPGGSGLNHLFGDIDALHDRGIGPGGGLLFSLVSDEAGFSDGDVLAMEPTGVVVLIPEDTLVTVFGISDGNLDVDAVHLQEDGVWLLSFNEDEDSTLLSGDTAGVLADGDVLRWDTINAQVDVLYTEAEVDGMVSAALGSSQSSGDTKGLARDPETGALLFSVQSPSAHDGSVFSDALGGMLLAGHDEDAFGFDGAVELDGLSIVATRWPGLTPSEPRPAAGAAFSVEVRGETPGAIHLVTVSLELVPTWFPLDGWGGIVMAEDALFGAGLQAGAVLLTVADQAGLAQVPLVVPPAVVDVDLHMQSLEWSWPHHASNPIVLELAQ